MLCALSWARCWGLCRSARMPAWIWGCRVLTRPSSISGTPVTSATVVTGTPARARKCAVLPVETIVTPIEARPSASSASPVLSLTEISALRTLTGPPPPGKQRGEQRGKRRGEPRGKPRGERRGERGGGRGRPGEREGAGWGGG